MVFIILNINLKGNYTTQQLKKYGELLQDDIEEIKEVKKSLFKKIFKVFIWLFSIILLFIFSKV